MAGPSVPLRPRPALYRRSRSSSPVRFPLSTISRSVSLPPCRFFSLSVCSADPSPRRGTSGRPAVHQKSRLSEFQPEPASAWLSYLGAVARHVGAPENVRDDLPVRLSAPAICVWSRPVFFFFFLNPVGLPSRRPDNGGESSTTVVGSGVKPERLLAEPTE